VASGLKAVIKVFYLVIHAEGVTPWLIEVFNKRLIILEFREEFNRLLRETNDKLKLGKKSSIGKII